MCQGVYGLAFKQLLDLLGILVHIQLVTDEGAGRFGGWEGEENLYFLNLISFRLPFVGLFRSCLLPPFQIGILIHTFSHLPCCTLDLYR